MVGIAALYLQRPKGVSGILVSVSDLSLEARSLPEPGAYQPG